MFNKLVIYKGDHIWRSETSKRNGCDPALNRILKLHIVDGVEYKVCGIPVGYQYGI